MEDGMEDKIRVLVAALKNGEKESVIFTDDFNSSAEDFFESDLSVYVDEVIQNNLPWDFPLFYSKKRIKKNKKKQKG